MILKKYLDGVPSQSSQKEKSSRVVINSGNFTGALEVMMSLCETLKYCFESKSNLSSSNLTFFFSFIGRIIATSPG